MYNNVFLWIQDVYVFSSYMYSRLQRSIKCGYESALSKKVNTTEINNLLSLSLWWSDVYWQEIMLNKKKWLIPACILSHWTAAVSQTVIYNNEAFKILLLVYTSRLLTYKVVM